MFKSIIIIGVSYFFLCLFLHIIVWKINRPKNDFLALFLIFLFFPLALYFISFLLFYVNNIVPNSYIPLETLLAIYLLHLSLSSVYIQSYPLAQAVSPSLKILKIVGDAMPKGLNKQEIFHHFDLSDLIIKRIEDLSDNKFIKNENECLTLTYFGKFLAKFFIFYRAFLGLPPGKG
ncbi:MAG: hypothetical protein A3I11_00650 [Elusimicrobia bacterium RIFCSPLOWO2_02_FULL_39_32]|nr:MAG: hypothetical protein A2034_00130 [Elusimicrobia bacterium GWA2_38_7]OGR78956.1 MAG: hypothetical protein A3B80_07675 [Elusimicrobia bacterium RIFCSPHIGHO2_02_FULL_39_36]OGR92540.1 MAG: hypothetical protein A3I11_00650 [Elusimicrobia bacterium RIFCSPLOWO2_02_FULL_39_32]OGR99188.1 MAG: hypothetical protein A3G85_05860 [Elusimicrobia bacterium RIFCSPLOWO2_12_FULL_39_28]